MINNILFLAYEIWFYLLLITSIKILLLLLLLSLVTGFISSLVLLLSQWWTPPLRLQVPACSTFLMMCDVPSMTVFVGNLLSVVLVLCPDIFVNFCLQFRWPQWLLVWQIISCSTFSEFLYLDYYTFISFQLPFVLNSYLMVLLHKSISRFYHYHYYYYIFPGLSRMQLKN
jgi:hypothetical protein